MKNVNLGCGNRFHNDWINLDFISNSSFVTSHDLTKGVPLADNSADVVYHSHVLEHFTKEGGIFFLSECYRILKPGGVIRVVIPDLEGITRSYIECLRHVREDSNETNRANYQWAIIELIDQLSRNQSGGEMLKMWMQKDLINSDFIQKRVGDEFLAFRKRYKEAPRKTISHQSQKGSISHRIKNKLIEMLGGQTTIKESDQILYLIGKFRMSGEIHLWMYDSYSLQELLKQIGFTNINQTTAESSMITNWDEYKS